MALALPRDKRIQIVVACYSCRERAPEIARWCSEKGYHASVGYDFAQERFDAYREHPPALGSSLLWLVSDELADELSPNIVLARVVYLQLKGLRYVAAANYYEALAWHVGAQVLIIHV